MLVNPSNKSSSDITVIETHNLTADQLSLVRYLRDNPVVAAKVLLGVTLEWYQAVTLADVWNKRFSIFCWSRQIGKTYMEAVLFALVAALYPDEDCVFIAPSLRQAMNPFNYIREFYANHAVFRSMVRGKMTKTRLEFKNGSTIVPLPMGDGCVAEALLMLDDGFAYIEDIVDKDLCNKENLKQPVSFKKQVMGDTGWGLTDYWFYNGYVDVKHIKTECGYSLKGSLIHPIKIIRNNKVIWARFSELRVGDTVLIDRTISWFEASQDELDSSLMFELGKFSAIEKNQYFPKYVMSVSRKNMADYLYGYIATAGQVEYNQIEKAFIVVINGAISFLRCMQSILLHFGIISQLNEDTSSLLLRDEDVVKYSYEIARSDRYFSRIAKMVISTENEVQKRILLDILKVHIKEYPLMIQEKLQNNILDKSDFDEITEILDIDTRLLLSGDFYFDKIATIDDEKAETYDIHIPNCHVFWSNGFISHNSKILGSHASVIGIDEYARIPKEVIDTIIMPMANRKKNPFSRGNRVSIISTPLSKANHYYHLFTQYQTEQQKNPNGDYHVSTFNFLDSDNVDLEVFANQIKSMPFERFARENLALFTSNVGGFFSEELLRTCEDAIEIELAGDGESEYVLGVDPPSVNNQLGIGLMKLVDNNKKLELVFSCGIPAGYITTPQLVGLIVRFTKAFNIVRLHIDEGGGGRQVAGYLFKQGVVVDDYECPLQIALPAKGEQVIEWKGAKDADDSFSMRNSKTEDLVVKLTSFNPHNKSAMYFNCRNGMQDGVISMPSYSPGKKTHVEVNALQGELEGLKGQLSASGLLSLKKPDTLFDDRADAFVLAYDAYLGFMHKGKIITAVSGVPQRKDIVNAGWGKNRDIDFPSRDSWSDNRQW